MAFGLKMTKSHVLTYLAIYPSRRDKMSNDALNEQQVQQILQNPDFQHMVRKKSSLSKIFSIITVVMYTAYMLTLGFNPKFFFTPVSDGSVTTVGIYLGLGVILISIILTAIYVQKANGEYDTMTNKVIDDINLGRL